jgi:ribose transport system substrate-binding protein
MRRRAGVLGILAFLALLGVPWVSGPPGWAAQESLSFSAGVEAAPGSGAVDTVRYRKAGPYTIGLSNISVVNTWRVQLIEEAKYEASRHSSIKSLLITDAGGDIKKQISDVEDLLAKGIDALIITPASPTALVPVIDRAYAEGIPVIVFSTTASTKKYTASIQTDEVYFGRVGMDWLAKRLGGKGGIIALRGIAGLSAEEDRWRGVQEVLRRTPGIKVLGSEFADWAYDKGKRACEDLLQAHPRIDGVWSSGGAMTQACAEAFKAAGRPLVPMTGEANNGFFRVWLEMGFPSIAPIEPTWISAEAVKAALMALEGQPLRSDYVIRPKPITQAEAKAFYRPDLNDSYWIGAHLPEGILKKLYAKQ